MALHPGLGDIARLLHRGRKPSPTSCALILIRLANVMAETVPELTG